MTSSVPVWLKGFVLFVMQNWGSINLVTALGKSLACSLATKLVALVGSMAFLSDFLNITIFLVTRPFSYFIRTFSFILKTFVVVVQTWLELLKTSVSLHLNIFWTTLMWIIAIVSLPGRILAALQRERQVSLLALLFIDCHPCLFNDDVFCFCLSFLCFLF